MMRRLPILLILAILEYDAMGGGAGHAWYGAGRERVLAIEPQGVTLQLSREFELQDGVGVLYVRVGTNRVARLVSPGLAARVHSDVAPLGEPDGKINSGDAWIAKAQERGIVQASLAVSPLDRLLLSSARQLLYEALPAATWLDHDHLGSLTVESDDQGAVIGRRSFAPLGGSRSARGDGDRHGFTGQAADGSGLQHFTFRELDPLTGRWLSPDPLFAAFTRGAMRKMGESSTAYAYVANNAPSYRDPSGLAKAEPAPLRRLGAARSAQASFKSVSGGQGAPEHWKEMQRSLGRLRSSNWGGVGGHRLPSGSRYRTVGAAFEAASAGPFIEGSYYEMQRALKQAFEVLLSRTSDDASRSLFDLKAFREHSGMVEPTPAGAYDDGFAKAIDDEIALYGSFGVEPRGSGVQQRGWLWAHLPGAVEGLLEGAFSGMEIGFDMLVDR